MKNIQTIGSKDSMKEYTKAYTAGLLDAEGCIGIYKIVHKTTDRLNYSFSVVIANTNLQLMAWLVSVFGGNYTKITPDKGRVWYQWRAGKGAVKFLSDLLPYIQIKKLEAELFIKARLEYENKNYSNLHGIMDEIRFLKDRECSTTDTLDGSIENKLTHAYMAGIFDGEGCISVGIAPSGKPILHVNIANNFRPLINLCLRLYSGWFQVKPPKGNTKEALRWWLTKKELQERFLLQVLPYLKLKKEQAKLALTYVRLPKQNMREEKTKLGAKIKGLNQSKIQSELIGDYESDSLEMAQVV